MGLLGEAWTAVVWEGFGLLDLVGEDADAAARLSTGAAGVADGEREAVLGGAEVSAEATCLEAPREAAGRLSFLMLALPWGDRGGGEAPTELDRGVAGAWGAADRWYTDMLGCSMSKFSSGEVSRGTEPEVKHGGGVTNQDSSSGPGAPSAAPELAPSSLSGQWYDVVLTARVSLAAAAAAGTVTAGEVEGAPSAQTSSSVLSTRSQSSSASTALSRTSTPGKDAVGTWAVMVASPSGAAPGAGAAAEPG